MGGGVKRLPIPPSAALSLLGGLSSSRLYPYTGVSQQCRKHRRRTLTPIDGYELLPRDEQCEKLVVEGAAQMPLRPGGADFIASSMWKGPTRDPQGQQEGSPAPLCREEILPTGLALSLALQHQKIFAIISQ